MSRFVRSGTICSAILAFALALACGACSSSSSNEDEKPAGPPDRIAELKAKFDGQGVVIIPFNLDDPACQDDPETMSANALGACAYMNGDAFDYTITTDPRTFDLAPERKMMLVVYGATIDPNRSGWVGIAGLGPLPQGQKGDGRLLQQGGLRQGDLRQGSDLHPQFLPLVVAGGYELLTIAIAAGVAYYGAKAIVTTAQVLNQQQAAPVVDRTQPLVERQSRLINCTPDEHELLKKEKGAACDNLPTDCLKADAMTSSYCVQLSLRRGEYEKCRNARQNIVDRCFGGTPTDQEHQRQIDTMNGAIKSCDKLISASCGG
jgi:hypothetical protein